MPTKFDLTDTDIELLIKGLAHVIECDCLMTEDFEQSFQLIKKLEAMVKDTDEAMADRVRKFGER